MYNADEAKKKLLKTIKIENIENIIISNAIKKSEDKPAKVRVDRIKLKDGEYFQIARYIGTKVVHENIKSDSDIILDKVLEIMGDNFKQCNITADKLVTVLMNKNKEYKLTGIKENGNNCVKVLTHNHEKKYILAEGEYVEWMFKLGLMDKDGKVINAKQKKFRQINKFLEMLKDIEDNISENTTIIDMGCGKSYLTFAMYHYFNNIKGKRVNIQGYDLKKDVVDYCNGLVKEFGFDRLKFYNEDIANIDNDDDNIGMIITLHACDTATDIALYHGIRWGCKVIMSVPCCQHELFKQIENDNMSVLLNHGILKERFASLLTDGIRARLLEIVGYKTNVMEFIDMEHTPKNIMIRAVKGKNSKESIKKLKDLEDIMMDYNVKPMLYILLKEYMYKNIKKI